MYSFIYDIKSGQKYDIHSKKGTILLKKYVKTALSNQIGGNNFIKLRQFPRKHMTVETQANFRKLLSNIYSQINTVIGMIESPLTETRYESGIENKIKIKLLTTNLCTNMLHSINLINIINKILNDIKDPDLTKLNLMNPPCGESIIDLMIIYQELIFNKCVDFAERKIENATLENDHISGFFDYWKHLRLFDLHRGTHTLNIDTNFISLVLYINIINNLLSYHLQDYMFFRHIFNAYDFFSILDIPLKREYFVTKDELFIDIHNEHNEKFKQIGNHKTELLEIVITGIYSIFHTIYENKNHFEICNTLNKIILNKDNIHIFSTKLPESVGIRNGLIDVNWPRDEHDRVNFDKLELIIQNIKYLHNMYNFSDVCAMPDIYRKVFDKRKLIDDRNFVVKFVQNRVQNKHINSYDNAKDYSEIQLIEDHIFKIKNKFFSIIVEILIHIQNNTHIIPTTVAVTSSVLATNAGDSSMYSISDPETLLNPFEYKPEAVGVVVRENVPQEPPLARINSDPLRSKYQPDRPVLARSFSVPVPSRTKESNSVPDPGLYDPDPIEYPELSTFNHPLKSINQSMSNFNLFIKITELNGFAWNNKEPLDMFFYVYHSYLKFEQINFRLTNNSQRVIYDTERFCILDNKEKLLSMLLLYIPFEIVILCNDLLNLDVTYDDNLKTILRILTIIERDTPSLQKKHLMECIENIQLQLTMLMSKGEYKAVNMSLRRQDESMKQQLLIQKQKEYEAERLRRKKELMRKQQESEERKRFKKEILEKIETLKNTKLKINDYVVFRKEYNNKDTEQPAYIMDINDDGTYKVGLVKFIPTWGWFNEGPPDKPSKTPSVISNKARLVDMNYDNYQFYRRRPLVLELPNKKRN